jgi:hypothetical protein
MEEIFKKYVPTFCQDIIASLVCSKINGEYGRINDIIINIYKNSRFYNFKSFLKNMKSKKNIIYTFSKITENLFYEREIIENNTFGNFSKQSTIEIIESIKSENDLIYLLKTFTSSNNKNLLVLRFSENNLNKINSVHHIINNYEKEYQTNKNIILMIHRQRKLKTNNNQKINTDLISFINEDYYQLFIDNLHGKENLDIFTIVSSKSEQLSKLFINETNFIENKIYMILSYMKITLNNETDDFNKRNCTLKLREIILKNKKVLDLIINNLELQSKSIYGIINEVFTSEQFEVNDVDFFEVISTK